MTILNRLRNIVGEYHVFEEQEGGNMGPTGPTRMCLNP